MRALTAALCIAAAVVLVPLWLPLVLSVWFADLLKPVAHRLEHLLGGRRRAGAAVVVLLAVGTLLPLAGVVVAAVAGLGDLLDQARSALEGHGSFAGVLLGGKASPFPEPPDWADLISRHGSNAWRALSTVARASAGAAIGVLVFVAALYRFLVDGEQDYSWLEAHSPIPRAAFARLAGAFRETGRGLIVAGGGTALVQGLVATIAYLALGIPRALLLGPLTAVSAIVPVVGTGVVWVPLGIELAATGQYGRAGALFAMGIVIGLIDNLIRPVLARHGHLRLPTIVVLVSMLGGVALLGATGALLGPLLVRLCVEALAITSDARRDAVPPSHELSASVDDADGKVAPTASPVASEGARSRT